MGDEYDFGQRFGAPSRSGAVRRRPAASVARAPEFLVRDRTEPSLSRRNDPATSARAAAGLLASGKISESQALIRGVLLQYPDGLTACELAYKLQGVRCRGLSRDYRWWRYEVSRRMKPLSVMATLGEGPFSAWRLERRPARVCWIEKSHQTVWIAVLR